jgi:hypothetical protein
MKTVTYSTNKEYCPTPFSSGLGVSVPILPSQEGVVSGIARTVTHASTLGTNAMLLGWNGLSSLDQAVRLR